MAAFKAPFLNLVIPTEADCNRIDLPLFLRQQFFRRKKFMGRAIFIGLFDIVIFRARHDTSFSKF